MERILVCSGQTSGDADGHPLHADDMRARVAQAFDDLEAVLSKAGFTLADVVRLNYFVTDVDSFLQAGDVWGARLGMAGCKPATTLLGITRLAIPTLLVEIEATAAR
jgi:enamine deaminase RidA (YjgF/YER057c/UK114 family)